MSTRETIRRCIPEGIVLKNFYIGLSKMSNEFVSFHTSSAGQNMKKSMKTTEESMKGMLKSASTTTKTGPAKFEHPVNADWPILLQKKYGMHPKDKKKPKLRPNFNNLRMMKAERAKFETGLIKIQNEETKEIELMKESQNKKRLRMGPNIIERNQKTSQTNELGSLNSKQLVKQDKKIKIGPNISGKYINKAKKVKLCSETDEEDLEKAEIGRRTIRNNSEKTKNVVKKIELENNVENDIVPGATANNVHAKLQENNKLLKKQNKLLKKILQNVLEK